MTNTASSLASDALQIRSFPASPPSLPTVPSRHFPLEETFPLLHVISRNHIDLPEALLFYSTSTTVATNGGTNRGRPSSASVLSDDLRFLRPAAYDSVDEVLATNVENRLKNHVSFLQSPFRVEKREARCSLPHPPKWNRRQGSHPQMIMTLSWFESKRTGNPSNRLGNILGCLIHLPIRR